ncbi:MAG TPA: tRNA 2-thiouridine(34) synthase MnmA [bacterium]|nr:tRNA 2-thiouridine(34) synthase MnmA [bacterium]
MRILVALSGGVDSSVAAALLAEQGHELVGLTMKNWCYGESDGDGRSCCSLESIEAARRVASALHFPHYVADFEAPFATHVIRPFVRDYLRGETPNPCVECNRRVRFPGLWNRARAWGCEGFATGHYVRIERAPSGARVRRALDRAKDQSYMLWGVQSETLDHAIFPLGELHKEEVRDRAHELKLPTAARPDSQEICFVPEGDYAEVIAERAREMGEDLSALEDGDIVLHDGSVIGRHHGIARYTIGQRRGLGIAAERPVYVTAIDAATNRVIVGEEKELLATHAQLRDVRWPEELARCEEMEAHVQLRSRHAGAPARITRLPAGRARLEFFEAQRAITPGQSAVFYQDDIVLGGGIVAGEIAA